MASRGVSLVVNKRWTGRLKALASSIFELRIGPACLALGKVAGLEAVIIADEADDGIARAELVAQHPGDGEEVRLDIEIILHDRFVTLLPEPGRDGGAIKRRSRDAALTKTLSFRLMVSNLVGAALGQHFHGDARAAGQLRIVWSGTGRSRFRCRLQDGVRPPARTYRQPGLGQPVRRPLP